MWYETLEIYKLDVPTTRKMIHTDEVFFYTLQSRSNDMYKSKNVYVFFFPVLLMNKNHKHLRQINRTLIVLRYNVNINFRVD